MPFILLACRLYVFKVVEEAGEIAKALKNLMIEVKGKLMILHGIMVSIVEMIDK